MPAIRIAWQDVVDAITPLRGKTLSNTDMELHYHIDEVSTDRIIISTSQEGKTLLIDLYKSLRMIYHALNEQGEFVCKSAGKNVIRHRDYSLDICRRLKNIFTVKPSNAGLVVHLKNPIKRQPKESKQLPSTLFIIGNGFDKFHNLPTSYWDFHEWLVKNGYNDFIDSLELFFDELNSNGENLLWSDFEYALGRCDIESSFKTIIEQSEDIKGEYKKYISEVDDNITTHFTDPLRRQMPELFTKWVSSINEQISTCEKINVIPNELRHFSHDGLFLVFNYTETVEYLYQVTDSKICHIHNRVKNGDMPIVGHNRAKISIEQPLEITKGEFDEKQLMADAIDELKKDHSLIIKEHRAFFKQIGQNITRVVVYGHSMSDIDMPYFEYIKKRISPTAKWCISYHDGKRDVKQITEVRQHLGIPANFVTKFMLDKYDITSKLLKKRSVLPPSSKDMADAEYKLDRKTVRKLFSYFSTDVMDAFFRQSPSRIDSLVVLIKDDWSSMIGAGSFILYNQETNRVIRDFFDLFAQIIHKGSVDYVLDSNPNYFRFAGYEHDMFESQERAKIFYKYVEQIQRLEPLYNQMLNHIKMLYKLDLAKLSANFEKQSRLSSHSVTNG